MCVCVCVCVCVCRGSLLAVIANRLDCSLEVRVRTPIKLLF